MKAHLPFDLARRAHGCAIRSRSARGQPEAWIKSKRAARLVDRQVAVRIGDIEDAVARLLDRQHGSCGRGVDMHGRYLCVIGAGAGPVEMSVAKDNTVD